MWLWVLCVLSALGHRSPWESGITTEEVEQSDIWHGAWGPRGSRQVGGEARIPFLGRNTGAQSGGGKIKTWGWFSDIAHDDVAPWGHCFLLVTAPQCLQGRDTISLK